MKIEGIRKSHNNLEGKKETVEDSHFPITKLRNQAM